ncbi:50S ribosomal protein L17 [Ligilactobacillus sp. Marseille-Q7487]|uniref:50S ribosomal protein L17 n=1 Tax=Ligilactobacillus sp. Marseille-Q7487 TaxID=3022128 RepID=UPI0024A7FFCF|nr:50S ribosomal protein L17 [Ligilactobacillus sp. Marseille-Q7487]
MAYRKLGRTSAHRKSMLRNLTTDVIVNGKIVTTETRAKEVRRFVEKMITLGKKGDLASRRRAAAFLMDVVADVKEDDDKVVVQTALQKLFDDVAPRYKERNGGYTRILKMEQRRGDAAKMVVLELVD